ncbi:beta strand repeat-containing protein [Octadecabacter arcticus]|uniref:beta strand repeat-containing protein n=1 Tax=Octadecabacter arcticus TaxID=53946 RepID=UPI0005C6E002|nr:fibronectin type III domain-containing protein [Octadecabacter arcticus]
MSAVSGTASESEAGGTATFTVQLDSQPAANVTIAVSSDDTDEATVSSPSLTFTSSNWSDAQTITVTGVDDSVVDGSQTVTISPAGVTVSSVDGAASEAGGTATFTVQLDSQPAADVTIAVSSDDTDEATVSSPSLTFTSSNWSDAQTITVTGVDDSVVDGDQTVTIGLAATASDDTNWDGFNPTDPTVSVTDDDTAGVTVSSVDGAASEAGGEATFTVQLDSQPAADVTFAVSSDDTDEATVSSPSLTFTTSNWSDEQTVTVTGVDDSVVDGTQTVTIGLAATASDDTNWDGIDPTDPTVSVTDDDTAGVTVSSVTGSPLSEAGGTATFTVQLDSEPVADVTFAVISYDTGIATVDLSSLTFTSSNWSDAQTITVTGVDDSVVDGTQTVTIGLANTTSTDSNYSGIDPTDKNVSVTDNDTAGVTVSSVSGTATEAGGEATFTVQLDSQPAANVTIAVSSADTGEATVDLSSLTFTTSDWNTAQTVTVTGVDDSVVDGTQTVTIGLANTTSTDSNYSGIDPTDPTVSVTDNDTAGVTVSSVSGTATEAGGTATFTIELDSQPAADVTIAVSSADTGEATVDLSSLTFTTSDWNTAQTVTVTGVDDSVVDGTQTVTIGLANATSTDSNWDGIDPTDPTVSVTDDDTAGVTVSSVTGSPLSEAGVTATFTVQLISQPTADVTIAVSSDDTGEATVSSSNLTFTASDWNTAQTVTVTGVDDSVVDGTQTVTIVLAATASDDTNWDGIDPADPTVSVTDNDTAGVTASSVTGSPLSEAGGTATFTVQLDSQPAADVTFAVSSDDTGEATVDLSSLTFTASNWNTAQTVTVTGVDDSVVDGTQTVTISLANATSTDSNWDGFDPADPTVSVTDDDTAGVTVSSVTGSPLSEAGGTATFTVQLDSQPAADVTLAVSSDDTDEATVSSPSLTFTASNWNTAQTVTVTGVDDNVVDGTQTVTVGLAATASTDSNYSGIDPADPTVSVTDNDTAGVTVSSVSGTATEAGGTATFTIELDSQPAADVTLAVSSDDTDEATVSSPSLTFTSSNWSDAQTITVTGVDDSVVDGTQTVTIGLANTTSTDSNYSGIDPTDPTVSVTDNDTAGVTVSSVSGTATEAGGEATFTVQLDSQPAADVTFAVRSADTGEATVDLSSLTFTTSDWNTAQTVTVTGVDDSVVDGTQTVTIGLAATASDDTNWDGIDPTDPTVSVTDDDTVPAALTISGIAPTADGATVNFTAASGGGAAASYEYAITTDSATPDSTNTYTAWQDATFAGSSITLTGLTSGTTYRVKIRAVNNAGPGAESAFGQFTPGPNTVDAPKSGTSIVVVGGLNASIVDNTSEVEIRFTLKDAAGDAIGPAASGHSVFASTNLGTLRQNPTGTTIPMRDNGDGTYSVWLSSPTVGDAAVGISVNDVNAGSIVVTFFASGNLPMALTSATPTYAEGTAFDVVATFARDVTGFAASDVVAAGATVGAIGTGPNAYTITLTPTGTGPITVSVPAGVAEETTNTSGGATAYVNEASNVLTISLSNGAMTESGV